MGNLLATAALIMTLQSVSAEAWPGCLSCDVSSSRAPDGVLFAKGGGMGGGGTRPSGGGMGGGCGGMGCQGGGGGGNEWWRRHGEWRRRNGRLDQPFRRLDESLKPRNGQLSPQVVAKAQASGESASAARPLRYRVLTAEF